MSSVTSTTAYEDCKGRLHKTWGLAAASNTNYKIEELLTQTHRATEMGYRHASWDEMLKSEETRAVLRELIRLYDVMEGYKDVR